MLKPQNNCLEEEEGVTVRASEAGGRAHGIEADELNAVEATSQTAHTVRHLGRRTHGYKRGCLYVVYVDIYLNDLHVRDKYVDVAKTEYIICEIQCVAGHTSGYMEYL